MADIQFDDKRGVLPGQFRSGDIKHGLADLLIRKGLVNDEKSATKFLALFATVMFILAIMIFFMTQREERGSLDPAHPNYPSPNIQT